MNKLSFSNYLIVALLLFTIFNPTTGGDILAFLAIAVIVLYKLFGDYALLSLLIIRPTIDYWRDFVVLSLNNFHININAGISLLLLVWSAGFFIKNYQEFKKIPLKNLWILFLFWCALSFFWSFDKVSTITETAKAANLFALFGMAYILRSRNDHYFDKIFFWSFISSAILPLSTALYQFFTKTGMTIDGTANRIYGTFAHPNILATFCLLLFIFLFDKYQNFVKHPTSILKFVPNWLKESKKELYPIALIILMVFIALTYTRIAWIGLAFFILALGLYHHRRQTITALIVLVSLYGLFFPINMWLVENLNINLQNNPLVARLTSRNMEADSITWRADLFNKIIPLWSNRPLIGYGYGSFARVWDDNKGVDNIWDTTSEAHNDYLKVGFESGLVGLAIYLAIYFKLLYREIKFGQKNAWTNFVFILSILVYLILSVSDNMLHHTPVIWWLWALWGYWSAKV